MNLVTVYGSMQKQAAGGAGALQHIGSGVRWLGSLFRRQTTQASLADDVLRLGKKLEKAQKPLMQHADDLRAATRADDALRSINMFDNLDDWADASATARRARRVAERSGRAAESARVQRNINKATERLNKADEILQRVLDDPTKLDEINAAKNLRRGIGVITTTGLGGIFGAEALRGDKSEAAAVRAAAPAVKTETKTTKTEQPKATKAAPATKTTTTTTETTAPANQTTGSTQSSGSVTVNDDDHPGTTGTEASTTATSNTKSEPDAAGINPEWAALGAGTLGATGIYAGLGAIPAIRRKRLLRAMAAIAGGAGIGYGAYQLAQPKTASYNEFKNWK